jgi:hypothetical protein
LAEEQKLKTRDDVVNPAEDDHVCSSELLKVIRVLRVLNVEYCGGLRIPRLDVRSDQIPTCGTDTAEQVARV